jgi:hypothetical protein
VEERRQRIWDAQRSGLKNRLRDQSRIPEARVELLLADWDAEAAERGLQKLNEGYWAAAEIWLAEKTSRGRPAP